MDIGQIQKREITEELKESYLDYAMSVIISRALPDARDGLKPVHRRILYAMWDMGVSSSAKLRKSAYIVGEVLGKYHPHGDVAVYDSLVRMAQDFSLRYPMIQGQGNFGCFTKDTKVKLTDGRNLTFGELVKEFNAGKNNYTYTVNSLGLISIAEIKHPRLTKKNVEIIKVVLDTGQEIRCTPNHLFMLKDGSYKEARHLESTDSLMPFYQKLSEKTDRLNREGYVLIYQPKINEWVPVHHLADNYNITNKKYAKSAGLVRHHVDFNKLNNSPENILRLHWGDHWKIHHGHASELHKKEDYRKKIATGRINYFNNPDVRARYSKLLSARNIENWKNPKYREKMRHFLSATTKEYIANHPERRKEFSACATKTLKRLWQNPQYRSFMHEKIIKGNKNHVSNKTGKLKFLKICEEILKQNYELNEASYKAVRDKIYPYGAATLWQTGLSKYFQDNPDLIRQEINGNHKIIHIEKLFEKEDVYDLTIKNTHNFCLSAGIFVHNSIDGDSAAAMRYTECRLTPLAEEMLADIDKETVDWADNYDGTRQEPVVLPAKLPQLVINGSMGIAVGMATNIPPHNLSEVIDALIHLINDPETTTEDLCEFVKGPDFPTGGYIYDQKAIISAYSLGKGAIVNRAKSEIIEPKKGYFQIEITEIPYQVNKSLLLERIAQLIKDKKIEGIRDMRDESDKEGLRISIDIKADVSPQKVLNQLFKLTDLQKSFHLNMLALADGIQPQVLSLKGLLEQYLVHRFHVVTKRTSFELKKAKERAHVLEGLKIAQDNIDAVISLIRKSESRDAAKENLMEKFKLSEIQANAILQMTLANLAKLERFKIEEELKEKKKLIKELEIILKSPKKIQKVIEDELIGIKNKYGDARKTKVFKSPVGQFSEEDLIVEEESIITLTEDGYIKRLSPKAYRAQHRGGKGITGMTTRDEDDVKYFLSASTHDSILFFTNSGRVFQSKAYEIPIGSRVARGQAIVNILQLTAQEKVTAMLSIKKNTEKRERYLVMSTSFGIIKKTSLEDFENVRRSGLVAINLQKDDQLGWAQLSSGKDEIILSSQAGQVIRFKEKDTRPMGRAAAGTRGMRLKKNDLIIGMDIVKDAGDKLLVVAENGYGKTTELKYVKVQKRGGSGIKIAKVTLKTGKIVAIQILESQSEDLIAISAKGQVIRTPLKRIPNLGRATQGVRIMKLDTGDKVASIACV